MNYTIDYFINKFSSIPEAKWSRRWLLTPDGKSCAVGHCGANGPWEIESTPEAIALINIFVEHGHDVFMVNDLGDEHPKKNVLSYLSFFKEKKILDSFK